MRKTYLRIAVLMTVLCAFSASAIAATHYVDCSVASSGNGTSWGTAWKALSNIANLSVGDEVRIAGPCTYTTSQWNPIAGTIASPIHYRVAQTNDSNDNGHTGAVTISLTGSPGMANTGGSGNTILGIWIDGNPSDGSRAMTLHGTIGAGGNGTFLNGLHLSYLTMDSTQMGAGAWEHVELDHNLIDLPPNSDHFSTLGGSGGTGLSGYTVNSVHDNTIKTRQYPGPNPSCGGGDGVGDDGFQWNENVTFANNVFLTVYSTSQTVCQHQDFIQTGGSFIDFHGNYGENSGNYVLYGDCFGSSAHWRVYNNVGVSTNTDPNGPTLQLFSIGFESTSGSTLDDITMANNTCFFANTGKNCIELGAGFAGNKVTNSFVVNNIEWNSGDTVVAGSGGSITVSNNVSGNPPANITFVQNPKTGVHVPSYPSGNLHLQASSTAAIGQGISPSYLTSVYTTDKDGNQRLLGAWDIGAYQLNGSTPPSPPTGLTVTIQ
jgi:hypothetical protein